MVLVAATTAALAWLIQPIVDGANQEVSSRTGDAGSAATGSGGVLGLAPDTLFAGGEYAALHFYAVLILAVFCLKGVATYGQAVIMNFVGQRILADMQIRLYQHLIRSDLAYLQAQSTGALISRFNNDIHMMRNTVTTVLTGIGKDTLTLVFLLALMFWRDWLLSCMVFLIAPAVIIPIANLGRRMRRVSGNTQIEMGRFTTQLDESFQGARHVKAYGMENYEIRRATALVDRIFRLIVKAAKVRSLHHPIMETLGGLAIVAVLLYGGYQVIGGTQTHGVFFSFVAALLLAYEPAKKLANLNANLQEGLAAAQRVFAVLDTPPQIVDAPDAAALKVAAGAVVFDDVRFSYRADAAQPALNGVSIEIPAGKTVALVGPSGAGKSTIVNLIPRFYDVDGGRVAIDGQDVRSVTLASLRANIGLVSQEISLFDDTVRANIAYGKPEAGEAEIVAAARAAAAHDFIDALPEGYDTEVGGRGLKLSGGQRQRIAIARAMLKNAPILLLDEATSALDTESERQVQEALANLMRGRTTVVIAHRLSTVVNADVIYVLEDGQVREQGSHAALLARGGLYARLYELQLAEEGAEVTALTGALSTPRSASG
ncbi:MAG: ABC transporter ATP-binding protein [Alphaproteobacteria bacterium]|nr:ABC transporter ATP-binding protein [Alphaproteobacteria bacterium]